MEKIGARKKVIPLSTQKSMHKINQTEKVLVENFVELQKVMVGLSEKFTNLSSQISKLLELFETSAKTLAEKGFEDNQEIVKRLDSLLDQNKIIAKGIALLHDEEEHEIPKHFSNPNAPPIQKIQNPQPPQNQNPLMSQQKEQQSQDQKQVPLNMQGYQKSISSS
ncbi:MAG: hypothetical protein ABFQ65_04260 [Nanoarchaeota archaeon]